MLYICYHDILRNFVPEFPAWIMILILIMMIIYRISYITGYWFLFKKAGEPGWKSLIPVYHEYVIYDLCWDRNQFTYYISACCVTMVIKGFFVDQSGILVTVMSFVALIALIVALFYRMKVSLMIAKAFKKGVWFGLGMFVLPGIFYPILGFGASKYALGNRKTMQYQNQKKGQTYFS